MGELIAIIILFSVLSLGVYSEWKFNSKCDVVKTKIEKTPKVRIHEPNHKREEETENMS